MKRRCMWLIWLLCAVSLVYAQESQTYRFIYKEDFIVNPQKPNLQEDLFHLDIVGGCSAFYSKWAQERQHLRDSLLQKGRSLSDIVRAESYLPKSLQKEIVYKNFPKKGTLTFIDKMVKDFKYVGNMMIPTWKVLDEQKEILGYLCQKAEAEYYGRKWTVWFSVAIPLSEGPWKLCGLPGMILEAVDSDSYFHFTCVGMETVTGISIQVPNRKYIECSHKEYMEFRRLKTEDLGAFSERIGGKKGIVDANNPTKKIGRPFLYLEK